MLACSVLFELGKLMLRVVTRQGSWWWSMREAQGRCASDAEGQSGVEPSAGKQISAEQYFLAGRDTPFWAVGLALFASNIGERVKGGETQFVGLALFASNR